MRGAPKPARCIECGKREAVCVTGLTIYPHRPDLDHKWFWLCLCGAYVGCHPGSQQPLGSCAGEATRKARSAAHAAFDPIWRQRLMSRTEAYLALGTALGLEPGKCHISWMTAAEAEHARQAAWVIRSRLKEAA
jgi:hypothetical protein